MTQTDPIPVAQPVPLAVTCEVRDRCLCLAAQRAARVLARRFDAALRPVGVTNGQFSLLHALNRPDPARVTDLATFLAMDRSTVTAALKALERQGLVQAEPDAHDRRNRRLHLTAAGHARLTAATVLWQAAHAALDRDLGNPAALHGSLASLSNP